MQPNPIDLMRRRFLTGGLSGAGALALASLFEQDGIHAAESTGAAIKSGSAKHDPTLPRLSHFAPRAKRIIYIYLEGGPSQMDLFDPKPELNKLDGKPLPDSMLANVRFAFIKKETARLMATPRKFVHYGQCGMEMSDLLPHIGSCDWNDGLSAVGVEEKGESVWLGWFLVGILGDWTHILNEQGDTAGASDLKARREALAVDRQLAEFAFGAERMAYEQMLPLRFQDTVARLLASRPPPVRRKFTMPNTTHWFARPKLGRLRAARTCGSVPVKSSSTLPLLTVNCTLMRA